MVDFFTSNVFDEYTKAVTDTALDSGWTKVKCWRSLKGLHLDLFLSEAAIERMARGEDQWLVPRVPRAPRLRTKRFLLGRSLMVQSKTVLR